MPIKFCPECGTPVEPGGRYCTGCGRPIGAGAAAAQTSLVGIVSLVALLALGGGFWLYFRLAPPAARPLKPGEGRTAAAPPPGAAPGVPAVGQGHPPIELPEDVKRYIANLAREAESKPKDIEAWQTLARVYYRASRLDPGYADRAEQAYHHLLEIDSKNLEGLRGLGNLSYDRQQHARAIELYQKYLALKPDDPEVRTDMGTMFFESDQADRAIAEYRRVIEKNPSFFQAYFNLAVAFDSRGDRAQARAQLEKARDLAPDDNVKQRLTTLLAATAEGRSFAEAAQSLGTGAGGGPPLAESAAAPPTGVKAPATFPASVEQVFRDHPVAGTKVARVEWPSAGRGRVVMGDFPMDAMPEAMRESFVERLRGGVAEAKARFQVTGPVEIEIVDQATGKVMATVTP